MRSTQCSQILEHIQTNGSITPLEALELYGCFRLGARVWDLRHEGFDIETEIIERNGKHYAKYFLRQKPVEYTVKDNQYEMAV